MALSQRRTALVERLKRSKSRSREGLVLVEGVRAVGEAVAAGAKARFAVAEERWLADRSADPRGRETVATLREALGPDLLSVDRAELGALSATEQSQGLIGVFEEPATVLTSLEGARFLVLDAVQDPGNVGTLMRAAVAFDLDGVLALDGTADPWEPKAVRSSAGMAFRLPVVRCGAEDAVARLGALGAELLAADGDGRPIDAFGPAERFALVLGNEGRGVRATLLDRAARVSVPMPGPAESLNVAMAGSILLHSLTRGGSVG